jgi:ABC-type nitrate/sulfonate/bicarbonate transport system substrate-binding protein
MSLRTTKIAGRLALAAAVALLAGCGSSGSTGSSQTSSSAGSTTATKALTHVTFALSYLPDTSLNGLAYAEKHGLFKAQGLDVEILPWGSTTPEQLIASGQADFGSATDIRTALLAIASGAKMTSLMATYEHVPYVLTTLTDKGYQSPKDLAGKTYGGFGSPMEIAVVNDMIKADGGAKDAENVTLSTGAFDALTSGRVDTVLSFPGDLFQMQKDGAKIQTWDSRDFGLPDAYAGMIMSSDAYIAEHPDVVKRFMKALQGGYQAAVKDPAVADADLLALYPKDLTADLVKYVSDEQTKSLYVSADGVVGSQAADVWQQNADWLIAKGLLADSSGKKLTAFDTSKLFTNQYLTP